MIRISRAFAILVLLSLPAFAGNIALLPHVATNADLKAAHGGSYTTIIRAGYSAAGDGGAATYTWNSASTCTDDGGSCVQPNSGTGRWVAVWPAHGLDMRVFGVKFDNATDNATTLSKAFQGLNANGGGLLTAPSGIALFSAAPASITVGGEIRGNGIPGANACADMVDAQLKGTVFRTTQAFSTGDIFTVATESPVVFRDFMIDHQQASNCANVTRSSGAGIVVAGANGTYTRNALFEHVECRYQYDCIRLDYVNGWQVKGLVALDWANDAVKLVNNDTATDYGDWTFTDSLLWNVDLAAGSVGRAAFEFLRGGSGAFTNNKVNGVQYGYLINRTCSACSATYTATALVAQNSFENYTKAGVAALQASAGADFAMLTAGINEFSSFSGYASPTLGDIYIGTGTPGGADLNWIRSNNFFANQHNNNYVTTGGAAAYIDVEDGQSTIIVGENMTSNATGGTLVGIKVAGNASGCRLNSNILFNSNNLKTYGALTGCAPTISACGTAPSLSNTSTDEAGAITAGGGGAALTSCTLTFKQAFATQPNCTFSTNQGANTVGINAINNGSIAVTNTDIRNWVIYYNCREG